MVLTIFVWLSVWGGMFSDPAHIVFPSNFFNPVTLLIQTRPLLPFLAVYICLIWIFLSRKRFSPTFNTPLNLFFFYCFIGIISSIFLSPQKLISLSWALRYLSCLLVVWVALESENSRGNLRTVIHINYIIGLVIIISILPEVFRLGISTLPFDRKYELPFSLGGLRVNGAGRLALVAIVVSFVRLITIRRWRLLWLMILIPSLYLITQTQSRTSLVGLVVCGILYVFLKGADLRFLFLVGPLSAIIFWLSAYKWRAEESVEYLIYLTGRESTWERGVDLFKHSPIFGSGFHVDRLMLEFEHMHNSYFHALVQSGALGILFFVGALVSVWILIFRYNLFKKVKNLRGLDQALLMESILIVTFLTVRSFFESTAAFYGVDLMYFIPAVVYIYAFAMQKLPSELEVRMAKPDSLQFQL